MKHLKLFEEGYRKKYSESDIILSNKITEYCEDYVQDILDECRRKEIMFTSNTWPTGKLFEWVLTIEAYYPIDIEYLIRKMDFEFEVNNWWIKSSGTSSKFSELERKTKLTISLSPKFSSSD